MKNALVKLKTEAKPDFGLAELTAAEQLLARVQTLPEARDLIASAEALKMFMKKADLGYSAQNRAAAVAIKARRKAGEMVKLIERQVGGRPQKTLQAGCGVSTPLQEAMDGLNVSHTTVDQWQRLAEETTEEEIDEKAEKFTEAQMELTTDACLGPNEKAQKEIQRMSDLVGPIINHPATGVRHVFRIAAEGISKLPPAEECASSLPKQLRHDVHLPEYKATVNWLKTFCDQWEKIEESKL